MRAILADDEPHLADDLRRRLARFWPELEIVAVLDDGLAAAAALAELRPDIAFLDIKMPGRSGLEAAKSAPPECRLVFVTAYDDHAIQAFELAAVDYVLKPVSDERLTHCIGRLKRPAVAMNADLQIRLEQLLSAPAKAAPLRWLRAQVGQAVRLVAVDEVCYFQSADKYTAVYTRDAELLLRTPLKDLAARLDPAAFWQVHRGTVVNVAQIVAAHHDPTGKISLALRDLPETIAVSRSYAHLFRQM